MPNTPPRQGGAPNNSNRKTSSGSKAGNSSGSSRQRTFSTVPPPFPQAPVIYFGPGVTPNQLAPPPGLPLPPALRPIPPLPAPISAPQPDTETPYRIHLPLHSRPPYIIDPTSLLMAVNHDPTRMFESLEALVKERDEMQITTNKLRAENNQLKAERNALEVKNRSLQQNLDSTLLDYRVARDKLKTWEQISEIQTAKQVVLMKMIDRLQRGEKEPPVDESGFWLPADGCPMAPVSEASEPSSEPSSEHSSGTTGSKDNGETKLDPHAQAFVPQSPTKSFASRASNTPYKLASASTETEGSDDQPTPRNQPAFINPPIDPTDEAIKEVVVKLPAIYFGVCPNSLSTPGPCPLVHCRLQPLCEAFNDENGPGCNNRACNFAHIYRSCTECLDGVECSYMQVKEQSEKKKAHLAKRVHPDAVPKKDWQIRVDIAGSRDAHKEMRY